MQEKSTEKSFDTALRTNVTTVTASMWNWHNKA